MLQWAQEQQKQSLPTVPSTISKELEVNPFLRVESDGIKKFLSSENFTCKDSVASLQVLRDMKNLFK
jgi:hypothetical protein